MDTIIAAEPVTTDVVAAMFENEGAAVDARSALVASGVAPGAIRIVQPSGDTAWDDVRTATIPAAHAHAYAEGTERGHALLFVTAPAAQQAQVMHLLEGLEPVDIMSRVQDWHAAGWNGVHRSQAEVPPMLFHDAAYPDHLPATGLLNEQDSFPIGGVLRNPMGIAVAGVRASGSNRVRRYEADPDELGGREF